MQQNRGFLQRQNKTTKNVHTDLPRLSVRVKTKRQEHERHQLCVSCLYTLQVLSEFRYS